MSAERPTDRQWARCQQCANTGGGEVVLDAWVDYTGETVSRFDNTLCTDCEGKDVRYTVVTEPLPEPAGPPARPARQRIPVFWTEWNSKTALFATVAEQGADLKESLLDYRAEQLDDHERAALAVVPPEQVVSWLDDNGIYLDKIYWGEWTLLLPEGWTLSRPEEQP